MKKRTKYYVCDVFKEDIGNHLQQLACENAASQSDAKFQSRLSKMDVNMELSPNDSAN